MNTAQFALELIDGLSPKANAGAASLKGLRRDLILAREELKLYQDQLRSTGGKDDIFGLASGRISETKGKILGLKLAINDASGPAEGLAGSFAKGNLYAAAIEKGLGLAKDAAVGLAEVLESSVLTALREVNEQQKYVAGFEAVGGAGAGEKTMDMLDDLERHLPQSEEKIVKWTKAYQAMGVTDLSQLRSEVLATASAQAIMGDQGADAYTRLQERARIAAEAHKGLKLETRSLTALYHAGVSETDLASRMGLSTEALSAKLKAGTVDAQKFHDALAASVTAKGGGPLEVAMNSMEAMTLRAKKLWGDLWEDSTEGAGKLTGAIRNFIDIFDKGHASGEAMGKGISGSMDLIMTKLASVVESVEFSVLTIELFVLKVETSIIPLQSKIDKLAHTFQLIKGLAEFAVNPIGVFQATVGAADPNSPENLAKRNNHALGTGMGSGVTPEGDAARTGMRMGTTTVEHVGRQMAGDLASPEALEKAHASGLALGNAAVAGIKTATKTHSPSQVAVGIGMGISEGLGLGMMANPTPLKAAREVSNSTLGGLTKGAANGNGESSGGTNIHIGQITIHIDAPDGVTDAQELSAIGLTTVLERLQIASGR